MRAAVISLAAKQRASTFAGSIHVLAKNTVQRLTPVHLDAMRLAGVADKLDDEGSG